MDLYICEEPLHVNTEDHYYNRPLSEGDKFVTETSGIQIPAEFIDCDHISSTVNEISTSVNNDLESLLLADEPLQLNDHQKTTTECIQTLTVSNTDVNLKCNKLNTNVNENAVTVDKISHFNAVCSNENDEECLIPEIDKTNLCLNKCTNDSSKLETAIVDPSIFLETNESSNPSSTTSLEKPLISIENNKKVHKAAAVFSKLRSIAKYKEKIPLSQDAIAKMPSTEQKLIPVNIKNKYSSSTKKAFIRICGKSCKNQKGPNKKIKSLDNEIPLDISDNSCDNNCDNSCDNNCDVDSEILYIFDEEDSCSIFSDMDGELDEETLLGNSEFDKEIVLGKGELDEEIFLGKSELEKEILRSSDMDKEILRSGDMDEEILRSGELDEEIIQNRELDEEILLQSGELDEEKLLGNQNIPNSSCVDSQSDHEIVKVPIIDQSLVITSQAQAGQNKDIVTKEINESNSLTTFEVKCDMIYSDKKRAFQNTLSVIKKEVDEQNDGSSKRAIDQVFEENQTISIAVNYSAISCDSTVKSSQQEKICDKNRDQELFKTYDNCSSDIKRKSPGIVEGMNAISISSQEYFNDKENILNSNTTGSDLEFSSSSDSKLSVTPIKQEKEETFSEISESLLLPKDQYEEARNNETKKDFSVDVDTPLQNKTDALLNVKTDATQIQNSHRRIKRDAPWQIKTNFQKVKQGIDSCINKIRRTWANKKDICETQIKSEINENKNGDEIGQFTDAQEIHKNVCDVPLLLMKNNSVIEYDETTQNIVVVFENANDNNIRETVNDSLPKAICEDNDHKIWNFSSVTNKSDNFQNAESLVKLEKPVDIYMEPKLSVKASCEGTINLNLNAGIAAGTEIKSERGQLTKEQIVFYAESQSKQDSQSSNDSKKILHSYFDEEKQDIINSKWSEIKTLNTDEERYRYIKSVWRNTKTYNPHRSLSTQRYRYQTISKNQNAQIRKSVKRKADSNPNIQAKRLKVYPTTCLVDHKRNALKKEQEQLAQQAQLEYSKNLRGIKEEHANNKMVLSQSRYMNYSYPTEIRTNHFMDNQERWLAEEFTRKENQTFHFYERKVCEMNNEYDSKFRILEDAENEIHTCDKFYEGISAINTTKINEKHHKRLMMTSNILSLYKNYYSQNEEYCFF